MLLGQRLGRCHQRRLVTGLDGAQHRVQGADRLAGPHLPHQQPLHRLRAGEVHVDLLERSILVAGQLEGERLEPAAHPVAGRRQLGSSPGGEAAAAAGRQGGLVEEQLLEGESVAGRLGLAQVFRKVGGDQGVGG